MLSLSYTLTEEEFQQYFYYICWQQPAKKMQRIRTFIMVPLVAFTIMYGVITLLFNEKPGASSLVVAVIVLIILGLLLPYQMKTAYYAQARKTLARSGSDNILTHYELMISERGIAGKTNVAEVMYSWTAFKSKVIVNNSYYLFLNIDQALVIPMRALTSPQEKIAFESILAQFLPLDAEYPFKKE